MPWAWGKSSQDWGREVMETFNFQKNPLLSWGDHLFVLLYSQTEKELLNYLANSQNFQIFLTVLGICLVIYERWPSAMIMCHSSWPRCIILRASSTFHLPYMNQALGTGRHGITEPPRNRSGQKEWNMVSDINSFCLEAPVILIAWHSSFLLSWNSWTRTEIPWPRGNWSHSLAESTNGIIVPIMGRTIKHIG